MRAGVARFPSLNLCSSVSLGHGEAEIMSGSIGRVVLLFPFLREPRWV